MTDEDPFRIETERWHGFRVVRTPSESMYDQGSVVARVTPTTGGGWGFKVHYLGGPGHFDSYETWGVRRAAEVALEEYLDRIAPADPVDAEPVTMALRLEIEAFVTLWEGSAPN